MTPKCPDCGRDQEDCSCRDTQNRPIHEGYKLPAGLVEILEEAADILYQDKPMRYPIVDELRGFASMLAAAPEVKP